MCTQILLIGGGFTNPCAIPAKSDLYIDYTWISRVFDMFVLWIEEMHSWRLFNNLEFWAARFPHYAESIRKKVNELPGQELFAPGDFNIFSFMDCTPLITFSSMSSISIFYWDEMFKSLSCSNL